MRQLASRGIRVTQGTSSRSGSLWRRVNRGSRACSNRSVHTATSSATTTTTTTIPTMSSNAVVATCNLAQWALDFGGNVQRIRESIQMAKDMGARYRLGPELEIPGYSCEDHFLEYDTFVHSWQSLASLLRDEALTRDIVCDVGMPVMHKNVRYNCRVFIHNGRILLIRPKMNLADDGNYREARYFAAWRHRRRYEEHHLPRFVAQLTQQKTVPFGDAALAFNDTVLGVESCEELFTTDAPHTYMALSGVEIIANGSGSHHTLRKLSTRVNLIQNATRVAGGAYLYANQQGCDGGRLYFDGSAMVFANGSCLAQSSQFSLKDVEVVTATVDLHAIRAYRGKSGSRLVQASQVEHIPRIEVDFDLTSADVIRSPPVEVRYHTPAEEIALGPACWLWDYLRRSRLSGFFLPLSGGADSSSTAAIVSSMCAQVLREWQSGNAQVIADVRRIVNDDNFHMTCSQDLAKHVLYTCYMGSKNSSEETRERASALAAEIGATHNEIQIDDITDSMMTVFEASTGKTPKFAVHGGSQTENLALQNIQARSRMVMSYMMAQLSLWSCDRKGSLLVLGSANVDEALRGYYTKYDCSAADINPIGGISKTDLRMFLHWASRNLNLPTLSRVVSAPPTAELEPITSTHTQTDEADMGMTYDELSAFGRLRKLELAGPLTMYRKLKDQWTHLKPTEIAAKVKLFFRMYAINRHKMTTLTPSYHAEDYSPDDNRYDLRPFLYPTSWSWQFDQIDAEAQQAEQRKSKM